MRIDQCPTQIQEHQSGKDHLVDVIVGNLLAEDWCGRFSTLLQEFHLVKVVDDLQVRDHLEPLGLKLSVEASDSTAVCGIRSRQREASRRSACF